MTSTPNDWTGGCAQCALSARQPPRLGDWFSSVARRFGLQPRSACQRRAMAMNRWSAWAFRWPWDPSAECTTYTGRCTGFGSRPLVVLTGPKQLTPDANVIEHCCSGLFQHPWIKVCNAQPPQKGCGFCLW
jgi:hypothetical protein